MELEPIIQAVRQRCPSFSSRVAGAIQFQVLPDSVALVLPAAYVLPLDDQPGENLAQNSVRQRLKDSFAVVIALSNAPDEKGQGAAFTVHGIRTELWAALLGWQPDPRYEGIEYEGGAVLKIDRARVWYQFEFGAAMEIEPADGWQEQELAALPAFKGAKVNTDVIAPIADPNLHSPGPDTRIEFAFSSPQSGDLPAP